MKKELSRRHRKKTIGSTSDTSRVVFIPRQVQSVRPGDDVNRSVRRFIIAALITVGTIVFLALTGLLGFQLGFRRIVGSPELQYRAVESVGDGVMVMLALSGAVFEAGVEEPLWLALGFAMIIIPSAGMVAARPRIPGGPPPSDVAVTFGWIGAAVTCMVAVLAITWFALPFRQESISPLPQQVAAFPDWLTNLRLTAVLDGFAFVVTLLWLILVLRLSTQRWMMVLATVFITIAMVISWIGFATSGVALSALTTPKTVLVADTEGTPGLLILGQGTNTMIMLRKTGSQLEIINGPMSNGLGQMKSMNVIGYVESTSE